MVEQVGGTRVGLFDWKAAGPRSRHCRLAVQPATAQERVVGRGGKEL